MKIVRRPGEMKNLSAAYRAAGSIIGLAPTMGALHDGHLSLLELLRQRCDVRVMSLFVNPAQFGPSEDFARYPRDLRRDLALCREAGVDAVFTPGDTGMYPGGTCSRRC